MHAGRMGEWVELAADSGVIGLAFTNGAGPGGSVVPYGSLERFFGTNPISAGVPVADGAPILIDLATSVVAEGKVRVARNKGETLPEGLVRDRDGRPTTDPNDLYQGGALLPVGGHKGSALSLLVDLLGGALTGQGVPSLPGYERFHTASCSCFCRSSCFVQGRISSTTRLKLRIVCGPSSPRPASRPSPFRAIRESPGRTPEARGHSHRSHHLDPARRDCLRAGCGGTDVWKETLVRNLVIGTMLLLAATFAAAQEVVAGDIEIVSDGRAYAS